MGISGEKLLKSPKNGKMLPRILSNEIVLVTKAHTSLKMGIGNLCNFFTVKWEFGKMGISNRIACCFFENGIPFYRERTVVLRGSMNSAQCVFILQFFKGFWKIHFKQASNDDFLLKKFKPPVVWAINVLSFLVVVGRFSNSSDEMIKFRREHWRK